MADWQIAVHGDSSFTTLRNPAESQPELNLVGSSHTSLSGGTVRDIVGRKWTLTWTWTNIPHADYLAILAWVDGTHGNGPFDVVDPTVGSSVLTVNVDSFTPNNTGIYLGPGDTWLWSPELVLVEV